MRNLLRNAMASEADDAGAVEEWRAACAGGDVSTLMDMLQGSKASAESVLGALTGGVVTASVKHTSNFALGLNSRTALLIPDKAFCL